MSRRKPFNGGSIARRLKRRRIYDRDHGRCIICGILVNFEEYEMGHLVDVAVGGNHQDENIAVMCHFCNKRKPYHCSLKAFLVWNALPYDSKFDPVINEKERLTASIGEMIGWKEDDIS